MRLFLDANVLFAAAITPNGRSSALFELAPRTEHELLTSAHAFEEARRNVAARYPETMERLEEVLLTDVEVVPEARLDLVAWARKTGLPSSDAPILAAAVQARADALVTGDRAHFGPFFGRTLEGVRVLSLRDALNELLR